MKRQAEIEQNLLGEGYQFTGSASDRRSSPGQSSGADHRVSSWSSRRRDRTNGVGYPVLVQARRRRVSFSRAQLSFRALAGRGMVPHSGTSAQASWPRVPVSALRAGRSSASSREPRAFGRHRALGL